MVYLIPRLFSESSSRSAYIYIHLNDMGALYQAANSMLLTGAPQCMKLEAAVLYPRTDRLVGLNLEQLQA